MSSRYKTRSVSKESDIDLDAKHAKKVPNQPAKPNNPELESCPCKNTCSRESNLDWICCDKCSQWWHTHCLGISKSEFKKLEKSFYMCPICAISKIPNNPCVLKAIDKPLKEKEITLKSSSKDSDTEPSASEQHSDSISQDSPRENTAGSDQRIVILDNVKLSKELINSKKLKSEINKVKPAIKLKQIYPLAGGGIALHCADKESQDSALGAWPKSPLNWESEPKPHKVRNQQQVQSIIIRSVNTKHTEQDLLSHIQAKHPSVIAVHRLQNKSANAPFPIIKVTLGREEATQILARQSLELFGKKHPCQSCHSIKIIRCFSCQRFGHTASSCVYTEQCVNCSGNHSHNCTLPPKCFNCNGEHKSDSKHCPTFLTLKNRLEIRKLVSSPHPDHSFN